MRRRTASVAPEALFQALLSCEYFRDRGAQGVELLQQRERPVSSIYQVRVRFADADGLYWIKQHLEGNDYAYQEFRFLRNSHEQLRDEPSLDILNPVAYLSEYEAFVTEHRPGVPLSTLIKRYLNRVTSPFAPRSDLWRQCYSCGQWLAALHRSELSSGKPYESTVLAQYIEERLKVLVEHWGLEPDLADRLLRYLDRCLVAATPQDLVRVRTHGDYAPYNIMASDRGLLVYDPDVGEYFSALENFCPRYEDIVHFQDFVIGMSPQLVSQRTRRRMVNLFLSGYWDYSGFRFELSSPAFRAFVLKYKVLTAMGPDASMLGRLSTGPHRLRALRRWFEAEPS